MQPEINRILELSTAHLPYEVFKEVKRSGSDTYRASHYGGVIVYAVANAHGQPELSRVLDFARQKGCKWVNFDEDAPVVDELPTWEW